MCQNFTDLNKHCPKDCYQLPLLDWLVDATTGNEVLSFLDAFSGYHQIFMHPDNAEKMAFIAPEGTFYYVRIPFGLKSAGSTYQRLAHRIFAEQTGRNLEVYIDDMIIKSRTRSSVLDDTRETFENLHRYNLKLNQKKCTFKVSADKFLGYMVSQRGIDANPDKIKAIMEMQPPTKIKEVQRLNGRVVAPSRFVSKTGECCLLFFRAI